MKLPSMQEIIRGAVSTARRFPFVLAVAVIGTAAAMYIIEHEAAGQTSGAQRVLFAALLGMPMLIGLALLAEKRRWSGTVSMAVQAGCFVLLVVYGWLLPADLATAPQSNIVRVMMHIVGMHLFVAIAPWMGRGEVNGFWQFNKTLFLRACIAALFTGVLFAGLAIALAAVENLFEIPVPGERYGQLWVLLVGMFATWFFLAGVPEDLDALDREEEYRKGLKIFSQYVLFPLVVIYFVILAAYSGKIIIAWDWPYGWVSRLILGFSAAGMFSLLLLYPVREREGNRWILTASRWFYIVLAPLLVMYFLAVLRRLSDYGLTEPRYIAVIAGVWLAVMVLYFLFSRGKNPKAIPLTMCLFIFLISVGPWGATSISERSQVQRLRVLLEKNGLLAGESLREAAAPLPFEEAREISAVLDYLREMHGYEEIRNWFSGKADADSLLVRGQWRSSAEITRMIGVEYTAGWRGEEGGRAVYSMNENEGLVVAGYDQILPNRFFGSGEGDRHVSEGDIRYFASGKAAVDAEDGDVRYSLNRALDTLAFTYAPGGKKVETLQVPLGPLADTLRARYRDLGADGISPELMAVEATGVRLKVKVYVLMLRFERRENQRVISNLHLRVLYGYGPPAVVE